MKNIILSALIFIATVSSAYAETYHKYNNEFIKCAGIYKGLTMWDTSDKWKNAQIIAHKQVNPNMTKEELTEYQSTLTDSIETIGYAASNKIHRDFEGVFKLTDQCEALENKRDGVLGVAKPQIPAQNMNTNVTSHSGKVYARQVRIIAPQEKHSVSNSAITIR